MTQPVAALAAFVFRPLSQMAQEVDATLEEYHPMEQAAQSVSESK